MNIFRQPCVEHQKEVGLFCKICSEFKCHMCVDPHYKEGGIIPAYMIIKYAKALNYLDCTVSLKNTIDKLYKESQYAIAHAYEYILTSREGYLFHNSNTVIKEEMLNQHLTANAINQVKSILAFTPANDKLLNYLQKVIKDFEEIIRIAKGMCRRVIDTDISNLNESESMLNVSNNMPNVTFDELNQSPSPIREHEQDANILNKTLEIRKENQSPEHHGRRYSPAPRSASIRSMSITRRLESPLNMLKGGNAYTSKLFEPINYIRHLRSPNVEISSNTPIKEKNEDKTLDTLPLPKDKESSITICSIMPFFKTIKPTKKLIVYYPFTSKFAEIDLNKEYNEYSEAVISGDRIFSIGGLRSTALTETYEVDIKKGELLVRANTIRPRYEHSLCESNGIIYCAGGLLKLAPSKFCERYIISTNSWEEIPSMITARAWASVFVVNSNSLYAVFGRSKTSSCIMSIEKISVAKGSKWEMVGVDSKVGSVICTDSLHGIQTGENEAIIFGGTNSKSITQICYKFEFSNNKIVVKKASDMTIPGEFSTTTAPVVIKGKVYAVDSKKNIHIYDTSQDTWNMLRYDQYKQLS